MTAASAGPPIVPWRRVPRPVATALTARMFATMGRVCTLRLPGCTLVATEPDHIVPVSRGGTHTLDNVRPACRHCNAKRGNTAAVTIYPSSSWKW